MGVRPKSVRQRCFSAGQAESVLPELSDAVVGNHILRAPINFFSI